jgi:hypothetical protein
MDHNQIDGVENRDMQIFDECFAELSPEAKAEIDGLVEKIRIGVKGQCAEKKVQMGWASAGGLLVALIRAGILPLDCEQSARVRKMQLRRLDQRR